jgi:uncharacterized protein with von Willebrand factor type A (vWA) domain
MPARDGALRLCIDFFWALRRAGMTIAPSQSLAAVRAASLVGFADRRRLRHALAAVLVTDASLVPAFDATFDAFFAGFASASPEDRLLAAGVLPEEIAHVRRWLSVACASGEVPAGALAAVLSGGSELEHWLARSGAHESLAEATALRTGVTTQRVLARSALDRAPDALTLLRSALLDAFGAQRAAPILAALKAEIDLGSRAIRERVARRAEEARLEEGARDERWLTADLALLDGEARERARRALRELARRLERANAQRVRVGRRGRVAAGRTLRAALGTWGVPLVLVRRRRPRRPRHLLVACDASESVRAYAELMLEAVTQIRNLVRGARVALFVSRTRDFSREVEGGDGRESVRARFAAAARDLGHASSYGRALSELDRAWSREIDGRTVIVLIGDGRSNYRADGADVLARWSRSAESVHLLVPERRASWGAGDSAVTRYLPHVSDAHELLSLADFERAVRGLAARLPR